MPMDDMTVQGSPPSQDWGLRRVIQWDLKLCVLPRQCYISGKDLWGRRAYKGTRWISGPGDPVEDVYWIERNEFLMWNLRGKQ